MRPKKPHAEGMTLRDLRAARGMTRQELAQALGHKDADRDRSESAGGAHPLLRGRQAGDCHGRADAAGHHRN